MSLDVNISEPDEFNCNELHSCLKYVAEIKGIDDFVYHVDYLCGKGDNYIANVFRISMRESESEGNNVSVIVKTLVNTTRQQLFHELHKREVNAYEKVLKKFGVIQDCLNVENRLILPECIYSTSEKSNEVIILEDLNMKGFENDNKLAKYESLDYSQVSSVLVELAKFHALSFIYEKQHPESFASIKPEFQDVIFQNSFLNKSKLRTYFLESFEMSLKLIENADAKKKLENIKHKLMEILQIYTSPGKTNVLCHGDCWINNALFKNEENSPTKVCFIDFQAMRYACPVTDIIYFLYLCTDSTFRSQHFEELLSDYYDSLKTFLNLYDIDVKSVYVEEDFKGDAQDYLPFGLIIALVELRIVTTTAEDEAILKESKIVPGLDTSQVPGEINYLKIRVDDVVNESIDNGVLDKLVDKINCLNDF